MTNTPTSGEIFITGLSGDVRSTLASPRDHVMGSIHSSRSPTKLGSSGTNSLGRASGAVHQPHAGLQRMATTNSIPTINNHIAADHYHSASGSSSATAPSNFSMNLPMRPAPAPSGELKLRELPPPPPVPRKEDGDGKKENRRQATFGLPQSSNGHYRGNDTGGY